MAVENIATRKKTKQMTMYCVKVIKTRTRTSNSFLTFGERKKVDYKKATNEANEPTRRKNRRLEWFEIDGILALDTEIKWKETKKSEQHAIY